MRRGGLAVGARAGRCSRRHRRHALRRASREPRGLRPALRRGQAHPLGAPTQRATAFSRPSTKAKKVGRLRLLTEDGFGEVYLLLSTWTSPKGDEWVRVRLPMRPNGRKGWVRRDALGNYNRTTMRIVVNRSKLRATLYRAGKRVFTARVGVGTVDADAVGALLDPREVPRVRHDHLRHARDRHQRLRPDAVGLAGRGVVGLHGTNQPGLIPGRPSHGCVRLRNEDIARLYRLAPRGTPVRIL